MMVGQHQLKYDFSKFRKIQKNVQTLNASYVKVGIFADKSERKGNEGDNVSIGAKHEFGSISDGIPQRSFLRMPLMIKVDKLIKTAQWLILNKKPEELLKILGLKAERIIQQAFATRGFGRWLPNAPITVAKKGSSRPLIDTAQLRKSIASEVVVKK